MEQVQVVLLLRLPNQLPQAPLELLRKLLLEVLLEEHGRVLPHSGVRILQQLQEKRIPAGLMEARGLPAHPHQEEQQSQARVRFTALHAEHAPAARLRGGWRRPAVAELLEERSQDVRLQLVEQDAGNCRNAR